VKRRLPVVAGVLVAVLFIGWYVAIWRPASGHLRTAHAAIAAAQAAGVKLDGQRAGLLALQRTLPGLGAQLRAGEKALPVAASIDQVIDQINAICVRDAISWTDESQTLSAAATSTSDAGSAVLALTLSVTGNYPNMVAFITDLGHLPRLIVVDSLDYAPGDGTAVTVTIAARAFYDSTPIPTAPTTIPRS
jgi:Tfp pilus assembly protein PilO